MNNNTRIISIALSNRSCLQYTATLIKALAKYNTLSVTSLKASQELKSDKEFVIPQSKFLLLLLAPVFYFNFYRFITKEKTNSKKIVLISHSFHPWNYIVLRIAKKLKVKSVSTIHDLISHQGEKSHLTEFIQNKCISLSDQCIFLSHNELQKAKKKTLAKSKVLFHPILKSNKINKLKYKSPIKVLFMGRLKAYKGIDNLLKTIEHHPSIHFTIAGDGMLKNIPTRDNLNIINRHLSYSEMEDLMCEHHYLILPYKEISQSGILAYGIACEINLILSDLPGLKEQLNYESAIWIENNNISNALNSINDQLYKDKKASIKNFKSVFNKNWLSQLDSLVNDLIC